MGITGSTTYATHKLIVHTGDKKGAGVKDAVVYMTFTDTSGTVSQEQHLTSGGNDDFTKGDQVEVPLDLPGLLKISDVCIRRQNEENEDDWYVLKLVVNHVNQAGEVLDSSIFPLNRWLHGGDEMRFTEYDSCLPQFDKNKGQRAEELLKMRRRYILSNKVFGAPPQVEIVPKDEEFTNSYFLGLGADLLTVTAKAALTSWQTEEFDSLLDVETLYDGPLTTPAGVQNWKSDEEFGNQKLAGCNPAMVQLCTEIPSHMEEIVKNPSILERNLLEGRTIKKAIEEKRLFKLDFSYMADIEVTRGKIMPGPTCLFFVKETGDLVPVAIQLMPKPAADNPVFTPNDAEYTWLAAKIWFNLADSAHHQSASHLGLTHLLMESVAVITNRQLSQSHPIYRLLAPHFLYIISINSLAVSALVSVGGWVDTAMDIGRVGMFNIIKEKWAEWDVQRNGNLRKDIKNRGVENLPNYFYRDDALLLWEAIEKYVTEVVSQVYDTPDKLSEDTEIHAWVTELRDSAKFNGMEDITSNAVLIELLTVFIFNSSVQHAAVNFGQYDEYGFPPNYPASLRQQRPTTHDALTEAYVVSILPKKGATLEVVKITKTLSERATQELGNFEIQYGYDSIATKALDNFKAELKKIQSTIMEKNKTRKRKYDVLLPSDIPNAISI